MYKRLIKLFPLVCLVLAIAACGSDGSDDNRVLIPNQEGLEEGLEFRFEGTFETPIGAAAVTGFLYNGGAYEVIAVIGPYTSYVTIGEWAYADEVFTLTDGESGEIFTSEKEGETYSIPVYINDSEIVLSATTNGFKEYIILEPEEGGLGEAQILPRSLLSTGDAEDRLLRVNLFEDQTANLVRHNGDIVTGNWSYTPANGLQLTIADVDYAIALSAGNYEFEGTVGNVTRQFSIPRQAIESAAAGEVAVIFPTQNLPDRYADLSVEEWEGLWAEAEFEAGGTAPLADYPSTPLDDLFVDTLSREYFTPVPAGQRGTVVRFDYQTQLYQLNEDFGIPEEEWSPVVKTSYVYLPAGYDESAEYNFYYLMHGAGGSSQDWFRMNVDGTSALGDGDFVMLLDYLMANGLMQPTVFVSVTPNVDKSQLSQDLITKINASLEIENFIAELEKDLVPAVEGYFASYLQSTAPADVVASRNHRAFGGLSMGAYVTWNAMASNIDSIAYFAPQANGASQEAGGEEMAIDAIYTQMREGANANYEVGFIFSHVGIKDHTWDSHIPTNNELYAISTGDLVYGENFYLHTPENGTHTAKYFILGVYNSMKVLFE